MDIGILTFQFANNYGAVLQCYALQEYLKMNFDVDVSIINYNPKEMNPYRIRISGFVKNHKQYGRFNNFRKKYLKISNKKAFELILVGSDQVWNPSIIAFDNNWINPCYSYQKIASYAASMGKSNFNIQEIDFFESNKRYFEKYVGISVREIDGISVLNQMGIKAEQVCDPVFLLYSNMDKYAQLENDSIYNTDIDYIFVYSLEKSVEIDNISRRLKKEMGLKIISIHPANDRTQYCDYFIKDAGPCEFLYLIHHSKVVITNSFHGLAFSILYKKKVYSVMHSGGLSSRQKQLYDLLKDFCSPIIDNIFSLDSFDYESRLSEFIDLSNDYFGRIVY